MHRRRRLMFALAAVLVIAAAAFTSCATGPVKPEAIAKGDYAYLTQLVPWLVTDKMKELGVEGLSIALVDDQEVIYAQGFGFADREKGIPATADTLYMAGSVSKLFTATAIMQLHEQGKVDIDKPLVNHLPDFSIRTRFKDAGPITLREMLTHHSGLPSDRFKGMFTKTPEPAETLVKEIKDDYTATAPGTVFSYSNLALSLLGTVIARAGGKDYAAHMDGAVLGPLGMTQSAFYLRDDLKPLYAKGYKDGEAKDEPALRDVAAGGLFTNVLDLAKFVQAVLAGGKAAGGTQVLRPATLKEMIRPQNDGAAFDFDFRIGLVWILTPIKDLDYAGTVAWHNGATLYHRAALVTLPAHGLGVAILSNTSSAARIGDEIAAETLKLALETKEGITPPRRYGDEAPRIRVTKSRLTEHAGWYETVAGLARVEAAGGYLTVGIAGQQVRLIPRGDGTYDMRFRLFGLVPIGIEEIEKMHMRFAAVGGRDLMTVERDGRQMLFGVRVKPRAIPAAWKARLGKYELTNQGDDGLYFDRLRIVEDDGVLVAELAIPAISKERMRMSIDPISDTEAVIAGLGRNKGETILAVQADGRETIVFSGFIFRKKP